VEKENKKDNPTGSTILKIPKLPQIPVILSDDDQPSQQQQQHQLLQQQLQQQQAQMPTKIRVRTDLMHLGLIAKPAPNLMASETPAPANNASQQLSVMASRAAADNVAPAKSPVKSNLMQLLSDPPLKVPTTVTRCQCYKTFFHHC